MVQRATARRLDVTKNVDQILAAADRAEPKLRRILLQAWDDLAAQVPIARLESLVATGSPNTVLNALRNIRVTEALQADIIDATVTAGMHAAAPSLSAFSLAFNDVNQRAVRWATEHALELITPGIPAPTLAEIRGLVVSGTRDGIHPSVIARQVRRIVPVTPRQGKVLDRMYARMLQDGVRASLIDRTLDRKRNRYIRARANTIARTEAIRSANMGQEMAWQAARDLDYLPPGTKRQWMANPGRCAICGDLDTKTTGIGEAFPGGFDSPPAHPNCRCAMRLVIP